MKKVICLLILFLAGCSSEESGDSVFRGQKRELGKGFYTIDIRTNLPEGSSEKYRFSKELYYKKQKIDEAAYAFVSPSGRYAVYESLLGRGVVLFDAKKSERYHVARGGIPTVEKWSKDEEYFVMRYYITGSKKLTIRVDIDKLKLIEE